MNNFVVKIKHMIFLLVLITGTSGVNAQNWDRISDLSGFWKFTIGDNAEWSKLNFNDNDWEKIYVPSSWENEGFYGYNGYAWYRKNFEIKSRYKNQQIYLALGYIDDVDEVYFNGKLIGFSGSFPPFFETAYDAFRRYPVPQDLINYDGNNSIAVRVYDSQLDGGITGGDVGLYIFIHDLSLSVDLSGNWKFQIDDNKNWKEKNYDDSGWPDIIVPGVWETQGYRNYNGFAWYRKNFHMPKKLSKDDYVLVLGKIDDIDEVYLNGKLIGSTGNMEEVSRTNRLENYWQEFRGYYIPKNLLNMKGENVVAVKVYDGFRDGGIYEGPIGIVTQTEYSDFWRSKKKKGFWEIFFGD